MPDEEARQKLPDGAWVFVSHSHHDFEKVREIRNALEAEGHKPLLFYLKCLEDDSAELPELLKREIEARTFFLLCDSANSRSSTWVQAEKQIAKSLEGKVIEELNLDAGLEECIKTVKLLSRRATVYMSYHKDDMQTARRIVDRIREEGYRVFFDLDSLDPRTLWLAAIESAIDEAAKNGLLVMLLSPSSARSPWFLHEIELVLAKGATFIPVMTGPDDDIFWSLPREFRKKITERQCIMLDNRSFEEAMTLLMAFLRQIDVKKDDRARP
jgi:hypothetical protein